MGYESCESNLAHGLGDLHIQTNQPPVAVAKQPSVSGLWDVPVRYTSPLQADKTLAPCHPCLKFKSRLHPSNVKLCSSYDVVKRPKRRVKVMG